MTTPHVIASSSNQPVSSTGATAGVVGSHYRVGKKIGEGSFGVVFEGILFFFSPFVPRSVLVIQV
jgi:casein kinase 1